MNEKIVEYWHRATSHPMLPSIIPHRSLRLPIALILLVDLLAALAIYVIHTQWRPLQTPNIFSVVQFILIFNAAVLVLQQIRINLTFAERKGTLDLVFGRISKELAENELKLKELLKKSFFDPTLDFAAELDDASRNEDEREHLKREILYILGFYERLAIGIFKNVYDEDILYDDKGFVFITFYNASKKLIEKFQKDHGEQRIFINLESLACRWKKRLKAESQRNQRIISNRYF